MYFHFKVPSGLRAYKFLSTLPKYIVPSDPMAGEEYMPPLVLYFHLSVPLELRAYKLSSILPK